MKRIPTKFVISTEGEGAAERPQYFLRCATALVAALVLSFASYLRAQDFESNLHPNTPQTASPARAEASAALEAKDYPKALKLLTKLAADNPQDADLLYDLGAAQDALDQVSPAEQSYRQAIADDANKLQPHLALGLMLARNGRAKDAREEFLAVTKLTIPASQREQGDSYKALAYRALARLDETSTPPDFEAARTELLAALKLSPETPDDIALSADLAVQAGDLPEAEHAYRRLLALTPGDPSTIASLGHVLVLEKKPADAEPLLRAALAEHLGDPTLVAQLATIYTAQDRTAEALPMVEQLHAQRPADSNITRLLAHLYAENGDFAKAEPLLAALIRLSPQDPTLVDDRGNALIHQQRYAEAEAVLQHAVADPRAFPTPEDYASAASHLAFAASENKDPVTTLRAIALRDTVLPPSPSSLFLEAISHDKLHHVKEAQQKYKQFLAVAQGKFPDQEFQARHRLVALDHMQ